MSTKIEWENNLAGSITLKDVVLDFKEKDEITFRKGRPEEYRLNWLQWEKKDFDNYKEPANFIKFLEELQPDEEDRKTLLETLASTLFGENTFKKFIVWIGEANSGKFLLQHIWSKILGDYAGVFKPNMLLDGKNYASSWLPLRGKLVVFGEGVPSSNRKLCGGKIKTITGCHDEIVTYSNEMIKFIPTFQMILLSNEMPRFDSFDNALANRLLFIKFDSCFYSSNEEKEQGELHGAKVIKRWEDTDDIVDKIVAEGPNVLMYVLKEIYRNLGNDIYESPNCVATKKAWMEISS